MSTSHPTRTATPAPAGEAGPRVATPADAGEAGPRVSPDEAVPAGAVEMDAAVAAPGARPGRRRRQAIARRAAVACAVLAVVLGATAWLVYGSPFLDVQKVRVAGQGDIPADQISAAAAVETGRPLMTVNTAEIERLVAAVPLVRRVAVTKQWPHTVVISVTPRTPVAVAVKGTGYEVVDGEGVAIGEVAKAPEGVPLMRPGAGDDRKAAAAALDALTPEVRAKVTQVAMVAGEIRLQLGDSATVHWGPADDSELKAKILAALMVRGGAATWFDVSVPGSPTTSEGEPVRPGRKAPTADPFFGTPATKPSGAASASPAAAPSGGGEQQAVPRVAGTPQDAAAPEAGTGTQDAGTQSGGPQDAAAPANGEQGAGGEQSLGLR